MALNPTDVPFFRYPVPDSLCGCGHSITAHRIDTQAQRCDRGGCPCKGFDLTHLRWRETRYVTEEIA